MNYVLAHFIGDFLLQNDWMAKGKKNDGVVCLIHVLCYILPFYLFTELDNTQGFLIALQHYFQDRYTFVTWYCNHMGIFGGERNLQKGQLPWGRIVVDQVMHFIWLWIVVDILPHQEFYELLTSEVQKILAWGFGL